LRGAFGSLDTQPACAKTSLVIPGQVGETNNKRSLGYEPKESVSSLLIDDKPTSGLLRRFLINGFVEGVEGEAIGAVTLQVEQKNDDPEKTQHTHP
jgi:hypothetical protein